MPVRVLPWIVLPGLAVAAGAQVPKMLVVQRAMPLIEAKGAVKKGEEPAKIDPNLAITAILAGELEAGNKVETIAWATSDPIFRAALDDGRIKVSPTPQDSEFRGVARMLGCRFTLVVTCVRTDGTIIADAVLYDGNARIFARAERNASTVLDANDLASGVESVARTLGVRINVEPLKALPRRPKADPDPPAPGQIAQTPVNPVIPVDLVDATKQADRLIAEGRTRAAILLLRDAVDADPFDGSRRLALIRALRRGGYTEEALTAARAALTLVPDAALRVEASRVLVAAGRGDEARGSLNEALAHDPKDLGVRRLLAELDLRAGTPLRALEHLDFVIATAPDATTLRLRAVCRALLGGADGVTLDWKRAAELTPGNAPLEGAEEGDLMEIVDAALTEEGPTVRLLFQKAVLRRDAPEVIEGIEAQERLASGVVELSRLAGTGVAYASSREARVLGLTLLRQCLGELRAYLASGKEDDLADARITMGEAMKNLSAAREAHLALRKADAGPR